MKTKKIVVEKTSTKKLMWTGGSKLLEKSKDPQVHKEKNTILVISSVLNVSPFGINVLGGNPYINKLGRKQKLEQYGEGKWRVEYRWIHRAINDTDKAICEAYVIDEKGKRISAKITGESSPASMKMSTLAGYQNHLAQTRAHNRVIEEFIGGRIHQEMLENVAKMKAKGQDIPAIDTSLSAEEISETKKSNFEKPKYECHQCGNPMTKAEAEYSKKMFKEQICRTCQQERKNI